MGAGVAGEASRRIPELAKLLGVVYGYGHIGLFHHPVFRIVSFPTKYHWKDKASLQLIERMARELVHLDISNLIMPQLGCGLGSLNWSEVEPLLTNVNGTVYTFY